MAAPDPEVIEAMWNAYYPRLKALIARKVAGIRRPLISDSEVALSAFNSLIQRMREGKFSAIADEESLWRLLKQFAKYKANDHIKYAMAEKRRIDREAIGQADAAAGNDDNLPRGVDAASCMNSPSLDIEVAELLEQLMHRLPDELHRDVLLLKLQGATTANIAECCQITLKRAQRLLRSIEVAWSDALLKA